MGHLQVESAELRHLSSVIRSLPASLDIASMMGGIPGGAGHAGVDAGYAEFAAFGASRLKHLEQDMLALADQLDHAASAYDGTDHNVASASAQSAPAVRSIT